MKIRSLGLYQPYAGLMLFDKIETRWVGFGRKAPFPLGVYLIYATQKALSRYDVFKVSGDRYKEICNRADTFPEFQLRGSAICVATLVEIVDPWTPDNPRFARGYVKHEYYHPTHRRVGLVFDGVRAVQPFAFKGKQGVGILTAEEEAKIVFKPENKIIFQ